MGSRGVRIYFVPVSGNKSAGGTALGGKMSEKATVYLYPPAEVEHMQPAVVYKNATHIHIREVPVGAIEFQNKEGKTIHSTLPFTVVWD